MLGTTTHRSANWVIQAIKNLVMNLDDAGRRARYLFRDRDGNLPALMGWSNGPIGVAVRDMKISPPGRPSPPRPHMSSS